MHGVLWVAAKDSLELAFSTHLCVDSGDQSQAVPLPTWPSRRP